MSTREEKKEKVIQVLNKARGMELQAITQYMNQHYGLDDKDFGEMAKNIKLIALDEMRHAEQFAERVKELGGEPTTELDGPVVKGQDVPEVFTYDVGQEDHAIESYNTFMRVCLDNEDSISAKIFEQIIAEEQLHLNYFDAEKGHIERMGDTYLAKIAGTPASTGLAPQGFAVKGGA